MCCRASVNTKCTMSSGAASMGCRLGCDPVKTPENARIAQEIEDERVEWHAHAQLGRRSKDIPALDPILLPRPNLSPSLG